MHNLRYRTSKNETNQTITQTAGRRLYQPSFSRTPTYNRRHFAQEELLQLDWPSRL